MKTAILRTVLGGLMLGVSALATTSARPAGDDTAILHVLNRIAYGPGRGDLDRVRANGVTRYVDDQLHPERVADAGMDARLAGLPTLRMSSREIAERFEIPQIEARRARRQAAAGRDGKDAKDNAGQDQNGQPDQETQRRANQVVIELSEQKLLRAVYSERQLQEGLADFWFNHFNVDARKGAVRFLLTEYERDTIRPRVFGKFRDLLGADAKSPAMLFYLDNWMSADPGAEARRIRRPGRFGRSGRSGQGRSGNPLSPPQVQPPQVQQGNANAPNLRRVKNGLNENYARELMELHTLGVDGGYTQKDVTEVARAFTGWTIQAPRLGGGFRFEPRLHDGGRKVVLGHVIEAGGGESDGEQVLDILARHPATARFLATKLVRRFVSDTPPPALVDRAASRFRETDGDLREVMRTILTAPEFFAPAANRAKVKTPFEFVVSAVRATGADVQNALPLVRQMRDLGMPLYFCQPPTGYADTADAWVNTGALVNRMNFALALTSNTMRGIVVDSRSGTIIGDLSESTRATIARATGEAQAIALALGSPEFQRR